MNGIKKFYQSKMFWFNVLALVAAIAAGFGYTGEVPADWAPYVVPAITVINVILRFVTDKKVTL